MPPLALDGPVLTIRRFRRRGFTPEELVANGTLTAPLAELLARAVRAPLQPARLRRHRLGQDDAAQRALGFIDPGERVVTIEDAAELRLRQPHVAAARGAPAEPRGPRRGDDPAPRAQRAADAARTGSSSARSAAPEALDMLTALSTGHDGSLCTVHAGSAAEALRRLETLALMADVGLPHAAIREQVADAIDLVVCQARAARRQPPRDRAWPRWCASPAVRRPGDLHAARGRPTWRAPLGDELAPGSPRVTPMSRPTACRRGRLGAP